MEVVDLKTLLKSVAVLGLFLVLGSWAQAANYAIPPDLNGNKPGDANLVGVDVIDSTGTQNYGLLAPCYLHWVLVSSATPAEVAVLRDTDTFNSTSDIKLTLTTPTSSNGTLVPTLLTLNPPALFRNGLSIKLSQAAQGRWMFGVRRRIDADISADPAVGTSASD